MLEQNKARAVTSTVDDDTLEQAFIEGSSSAAPTAAATNKKRTREDIVRELKNKRPKTDDGGENDVTIEEAKKTGKFKPIGFKPMGASAEEGKAKKKVKKGEREKDGVKKKKKKVQEGGEMTNQDESSTSLLLPNVDVNGGPSKPAQPEPEPVPEDLDIFADAGEYTGLDLGDDEEEEEKVADRSDSEASVTDAPLPTKANWFDDAEEGEVTAPLPEKSEHKSASPPPKQPPGHEPEEGEAEEEDAPMRLVPLASSSIPSIKDILAMDDATQKEQKRKARKEKKKATLNTEGKVDRDYQR